MNSNIKAMVAEISEEYLPILEELVEHAEQAVALKAENSRLREAISEAPHNTDCAYVLWFGKRACNCWIVSALAGEVKG